MAITTDYKYEDGQIYYMRDRAGPVELREHFSRLLEGDAYPYTSADRLDSYNDEQINVTNFVMGLDPQAVDGYQKKRLTRYVDRVHIEELYFGLMKVRAHLLGKGRSYVTRDDISMLRHPIDWYTTSKPPAIRFEQAIREELERRGFRDYKFPSDSPILRHSLGKYIELAVRLGKNGINQEEGTQLVEIAAEAQNPQIQTFLYQLATRGSFITRASSHGLILDDRDLTQFAGLNYCLNFSDSEKELHCNTLGALGLGYKGHRKVKVNPASLGFTSDEVRREIAEKARLGLPFFNEEMGLAYWCEIVRRNVTNSTLVRLVVNKVFNALIMPESAAVVSTIFLNIFTEPYEIGKETQRLYGDIVINEVGELGKRFLETVESFGLAAGDITYYDQRRGRLVAPWTERAEEFHRKAIADLSRALNAYRKFIRQFADNMKPDERREYERKAQASIDALKHRLMMYRDRFFFRDQILDEEYLHVSNDIAEDTLTSYRVATASAYDYFLANMGLGGSGMGEIGAFVGFIAPQRYVGRLGFGFLRSIPLYILPIISGAVTLSAVSAPSMAGERGIVELYLPTTTSTLAR